MRVLIVVLVLGLSACAAGIQPNDRADAGSGRQCFADTNLRIIQNEGSRSLYVRAASNEALRLDTPADCFTDRGNPSYDFRPLGGPNARLCIGDPVRVDLRSSAIGLRTCQATVEARLSEHEVAALPDRRLP